MNKKNLLNGLAAFAMLLMFSNSKVDAQNIAINSTGTAANASSMLDISSGASSNRGLLIPRVTSAQKTAMNPLPAAAQGLTVYQTDGVEGFYYNTSTTTTPAWSYLSPSTGWSILGNAGTSVATNFLGTTDAIAFAIRTNNTERIRVTSAGNVGIGLTNPIYNLEINGTFGYGDGIAGTYRSRTESRADAGLQGSSGAQSGFFQTSAPAPAANWPTGAASWWHLLDVRHSNDANNYAMQFAGSFFDQRLYFRKTNSAANTAWSEVLMSSSLFNQGITMASATAETQIVGNSTGSYSNAAGAGYTPGTYISIPGMSATRTITTGNDVQVTFSARWEGDDFNYWAPDMIWFRILRDGTAIATTCAYVDGSSYWYFTDGDVSLTTKDVGITAGSHTWTAECWITNSTAGVESFFIGERYLTVTEIKP